MTCGYCGSRFVSSPQYSNRINHAGHNPTYFCSNSCLVNYVRNEDKDA